jgi:hypothetical protein
MRTAADPDSNMSHLIGIEVRAITLNRAGREETTLCHEERAALGLRVLGLDEGRDELAGEIFRDVDGDDDRFTLLFGASGVGLLCMRRRGSAIATPVRAATRSKCGTNVRVTATVNERASIATSPSEPTNELSGIGVPRRGSGAPTSGNPDTLLRVDRQVIVDLEYAGHFARSRFSDLFVHVAVDNAD